MTYRDTAALGVVFITHNAARHLARSLPPIVGSPLQPRVLVVNSSSDDGTVEAALRLGADVLVIPRDEFNHGTTREFARRFIKSEIVVMMTPDAYAVDDTMLGRLVAPVAEGRASLTYGRQIAHDGANPLVAFVRAYNYPAESQLRTPENAREYGVYATFCSNSFAAYRNSAIAQVGGFKAVLTGEDTIAASELLTHGHTIAYVSEAVVRHSHSYSLAGEFRRYFDTGYARAAQGRAARQYGSDVGRGRSMVQAMVGEMARQIPWLVPRAIVQSGVQWAGYQAGRLSSHAPRRLTKAFSAQDYYWTSRVFAEGWAPSGADARRYHHLLADEHAHEPGGLIQPSPK